MKTPALRDLFILYFDTFTAFCLLRSDQQNMIYTRLSFCTDIFFDARSTNHCHNPSCKIKGLRLVDGNAVPGTTKDVDPGKTPTCVNHVKQHQYPGRVKTHTKALASLRKSKPAAVQQQKKHGYIVKCSMSFWLGFNDTLYWLIHYHIISHSSPSGLKGKAWNERGEIEILAGSEPSQPITRMKFRQCVSVTL